MKALKAMALGSLLALASQAAALMDISAFGGYTTVGMDNLNEAISDALTTSPGSSGTKFGSGIYVGADAGFTTLPFLKIGPRVEYVDAGQASLTYAGGTKSTIDANLLLLEAGVTVDTSLPLSGFSVLGGLWAGYGMGHAGNKVVTPSTQDSLTGSGSGFVAELGGQLRYNITAGLSLGLDLGYRLATISKMTADKDGSGMFSGVKSGDIFFHKVGSSTDAAAVDFSGLNAGGALSFSF